MIISGERAIDGTRRTTIDSGLSARDFAKTRMHETLVEQGYALAFDGTISRWSVSGTICDREGTAEEAMVAYGPAFGGTTLLSLIEGDDVEAAWSAFYRFTAFFERVASYGTVGREARAAAVANGPGGILASPDGGFLVLPTGLYARSLLARGAECVARERLLWTYPDEDRDESRRFGFMAGTLAYRVMSGKSPFEAVPSRDLDAHEVADAIARLMRAADFVPVELENASVRKPAADCVNALVTIARATSLDTLLAFGEDYRSVLDPSRGGSGASTEVSRTRERIVRGRMSRAKRADFFRVRGRALAIAAIALTAMAAFAISWARDAAGRPTTKGMSPREVVLGYYEAIGELDTARIGSYGARGAKNDYDTLASTLFVSTRMRLNYEASASLVTPGDLALNGPKKGQSVFGVTGLSVEELDSSEDAANFRVSLYLWVPAIEDGARDTGWIPTEAEEPLTVYRHRDKVTVRLIKGLWLVERVMPEERFEVIAGTGAISEALASGEAPPWAPTR